MTHHEEVVVCAWMVVQHGQPTRYHYYLVKPKGGDSQEVDLVRRPDQSYHVPEEAGGEPLFLTQGGWYEAR